MRREGRSRDEGKDKGIGVDMWVCGCVGVGGGWEEGGRRRVILS